MNDKKNVILITIDCLRADNLGCINNLMNQTPVIDKIARRGVLFRQAIANGPNTFCSFPSILASSYPLMNLLGEELGLPSNWIFMSKDNFTLAQVLKRNSYSTAAFHSNPWISSFFNYDKGFDVFEDSLNRTIGESLFFREIGGSQKLLYYIRLLGSLDALVKRAGKDAKLVNTEAISWLSRRKHESFFLWLHYMDLHAPYIPSQPTLSEIVNAIKLQAKIEFTHRFASQGDVDLAKIMYDKSTASIIITSDHGEQFMEHGSVGHGLLYDEVVHVPLVICGPEVENKAIVDNQISLLDLSPTIIDILGIKKVKSFLGESLLPMITGNADGERTVISESISDRGWKEYAVRTGRWKYIYGKNGRTKEELYCLASDPQETKNLARQEIEVKREMEKSLLMHIETEIRARRTAREKNAIKRRVRKLADRGLLLKGIKG
jgi:arylsulfatase A-like enzyme